MANSMEHQNEMEDASETTSDKQAPMNVSPKGTGAVLVNPGEDELITREIPTSWEVAGPEDRMVFTMRQAGFSWASIRKAWKEMMGAETGILTLPIRYSRIKRNMDHLAEGDDERLLAAKEEVEANFKYERYGLIAEELEERLRGRYSAILYSYGQLLREAKECVEASFKADKSAQITQNVERRGGRMYSVFFIERELQKIEAAEAEVKRRRRASMRGRRQGRRGRLARGCRRIGGVSGGTGSSSGGRRGIFE